MNSFETTTQPKSINPDGPSPIVILTSKAIEKVKEFLAKDSEAANKHFRISVEGGGCSGFQYGFSFDQKRDGDLLVSCDSVEVLIDTQTRPYIHGSTVEYLDGLNESGFSVQNPNAKGTCGCGVSFNV